MTNGVLWACFVNLKFFLFVEPGLNFENLAEMGKVVVEIKMTNRFDWTLDIRRAAKMIPTPSMEKSR